MLWAFFPRKLRAGKERRGVTEVFRYIHYRISLREGEWEGYLAKYVIPKRCAHLVSEVLLTRKDEPTHPRSPAYTLDQHTNAHA